MSKIPSPSKTIQNNANNFPVVVEEISEVIKCFGRMLSLPKFIDSWRLSGFWFLFQQIFLKNGEKVYIQVWLFLKILGILHSTPDKNSCPWKNAVALQIKSITHLVKKNSPQKLYSVRKEKLGTKINSIFVLVLFQNF